VCVCVFVCVCVDVCIRMPISVHTIVFSPVAGFPPFCITSWCCYSNFKDVVPERYVQGHMCTCHLLACVLCERVHVFFANALVVAWSSSLHLLCFGQSHVHAIDRGWPGPYICTPCMTVCMVIPLLKTLYIHRIYVQMCGSGHPYS
jgi:hypothetical protein